MSNPVVSSLQTLVTNLPEIGKMQDNSSARRQSRRRITKRPTGRDRRLAMQSSESTGATSLRAHHSGSTSTGSEPINTTLTRASSPHLASELAGSNSSIHTIAVKFKRMLTFYLAEPASPSPSQAPDDYSGESAAALPEIDNSQPSTSSAVTNQPHPIQFQFWIHLNHFFHCDSRKCESYRAFRNHLKEKQRINVYDIICTPKGRRIVNYQEALLTLLCPQFKKCKMCVKLLRHIIYQEISCKCNNMPQLMQIQKHMQTFLTKMPVKGKPYKDPNAQDLQLELRETTLRLHRLVELCTHCCRKASSNGMMLCAKCCSKLTSKECEKSLEWLKRMHDATDMAAKHNIGGIGVAENVDLNSGLDTPCDKHKLTKQEKKQLKKEIIKCSQMASAEKVSACATSSGTGSNAVEGNDGKDSVGDLATAQGASQAKKPKLLPEKGSGSSSSKMIESLQPLPEPHSSKQFACSSTSNNDVMAPSCAGACKSQIPEKGKQLPSKPNKNNDCCPIEANAYQSIPSFYQRILGHNVNCRFCSPPPATDGDNLIIPEFCELRIVHTGSDSPPEKQGIKIKIKGKEVIFVSQKPTSNPPNENESISSDGSFSEIENLGRTSPRSCYEGFDFAGHLDVNLVHVGSSTNPYVRASWLHQRGWQVKENIVRNKFGMANINVTPRRSFSYPEEDWETELCRILNKQFPQPEKLERTKVPVATWIVSDPNYYRL